MKINLKVKRYDPEEQGNGRVWWQDYSVEASESTTVLDALIKVREEQDGTLGCAVHVARRSVVRAECVSTDRPS